jgi:hypothetical protein
MAFDLHVASNFSCSPVFCLKLRLHLIIFQSLYSFYDMSKCVLLFVSYISSLLLYSSCISCFNCPSSASVLHNFILVLFRLNTYENTTREVESKKGYYCKQVSDVVCTGILPTRALRAV